MKNQELKNILDEYTVPNFDDEIMNKTIENIHNMNLYNFDRKTDNKKFLISQIGFIRKRIWIMQFLILFIVCTFFIKEYRQANISYEFFSLISMVSPLFVLINVQEIARVYYHSMLEIELATKYSLQKAVITRLIIFGVIDLIGILIITIFASKSMEISFSRAIVYSLVPFNLICIGCMFIIEKSKGKNIKKYCIMYGILLMGITRFLGAARFHIYDNNEFIKWINICIITAFVLNFQFRKMYKNINKDLLNM